MKLVEFIKWIRLRFSTPFQSLKIISMRLALLVFATVTVSAQASLTHKYNFNDGTANDYVGGANGRLVNGATVSGGKLVLANNGTNANPATGQYVSLPANILKTLNFTVECWFTWNGGKPWQRILDLGNSDGVNGQNFIILTMNSGFYPLGQITLNGTYDSVAGNASNIFFPQGGKHDLAYVFNWDTSQQQLYLDGSLIASGRTYKNPSTASYTNFWIGRSQFRADPFFAGSIDELRTYDNALTGTQIQADWTAGPDVFQVHVATIQNTNLFFAATDLTTYGVAGLTNAAPNLTISSVSPTSTQQGSLSLVTTQAWERRYDGPGHWTDNAIRVVVDGMQNVIVAGYSLGSTYDFVTIKYASDGTPLWTNRYDGPAHLDDYARCLAVDASGNVYATGTSEVTNNTWDLVTLKYSADGNLLWASRYNRYGTNYCDTGGLAVDIAGNAFVTANIFYADTAFITVKYDPQGNAVWTNYYKGSSNGYDYPLTVAVDNSGNIFVTGNSDMGQQTETAYTTLKYAPDGTTLWTNRYVNGWTTIPRTMTLDRNGNVIVTGDVASQNSLYATVKYSNDGIPLWTNLAPTPNYQGGDVPRVVADVAGNVFMTGGSPGANSYNADFTTVKLSASGVPLWTNRFFEVNSNNPAPAGTAVDSAGNFYFAGHAGGPGGTNIDYVTVKYAAIGNSLWTNRYDGVTPNSEDWPNDIAVDHAGNVYVTGLSGGFSGDFATVKYSDYICYTPPTNFVGTDTFTFTAVDSFGNGTTGTVIVVVSPTNLQFNTSVSPLRFDALGMRLQVDGARGTNKVIIYASTNLVYWEPILTNQPAFGSVQFIDFTATNMQRRFYRAVQ